MSKGKFFLVFVIALTLVIVLNSCGGQKTEPSAQKTTTTAPVEEPKKETPPETGPAPSAQPSAPKVEVASPVAGGKPKIVCDEPEYDFGEKRNDEKIEHEFIVKNSGDGLLLINSVKTTCGCTVAQPEKKELQPNESTKIKATLTLANRQGPQTKNITVESNDPENPVLTLTIKGVATAPIIIEPRTINLGTSIIDDLVEEKIVEVKGNIPDFSFNITNVDMSSLPQFKAEVETVEPGKNYKVKLIQTEKIEPGTTLSKSFTIETDASLPGKDEKDPSVSFLRKIPVSVYGRFIAEVDVSPEVISIRSNNEDPEAKTQQYLRIKEGREKGLKITEVVSPTPDIQVELTERAPGDYLLLVKNIPMNNSIKDKEIIVKTTSATKPEVKIPFKVIDIPNLPTRPGNVMKGNIKPNSQGPQLPSIKIPPKNQLPKPPPPPQQQAPENKPSETKQ